MRTARGHPAPSIRDARPAQGGGARVPLVAAPPGHGLRRRHVRPEV